MFCRWEEEGSPEEHIWEIVHLKQANAESIYFALVECLKDKKSSGEQNCWNEV